jgi:hypothetical protein
MHEMVRRQEFSIKHARVRLPKGIWADLIKRLVRLFLANQTFD